MNLPPTGFDHTANRLGALALRITDEMRAALSQRSPSHAAALSAIRNLLEEPSIDQLRAVLGLTSSGTVRLVDSLAAAGLVVRRRGSGPDRRVSSVALTAKGRRAADALVGARAAVLTAALNPLSAAERTQLEGLLHKILVGRIRSGSTGEGWMCRLCDTSTCGAEARGQPCPVTRAALARSPT